MTKENLPWLLLLRDDELSDFELLKEPNNGLFAFDSKMQMRHRGREVEAVQRDFLHH
jgi:hypothetical protein